VVNVGTFRLNSGNSGVPTPEISPVDSGNNGVSQSPDVFQIGSDGRVTAERAGLDFSSPSMHDSGNSGVGVDVAMGLK
jgi:hypothetical protein